jgi:hypothetical protein
LSEIQIVDLYKKEYDYVKFNADKAWETIKFCTTIVTTLITVTVSLLGAINYLTISPIVKVFLMVALVAFPIISLKVIGVTEKNFERELRRMYEALTIIMKIEAYLPLRKDVKVNRVFGKENTFIPPEWEENKYPTTKGYIDAMIKADNKFYSSMKPIFSVFRIVSALVLGLIVSIILVVLIQTILFT